MGDQNNRRLGRVILVLNWGVMYYDDAGKPLQQMWGTMMHQLRTILLNCEA